VKTGPEHAIVALTIDWDYPNHTIDISIPGYIECEPTLQHFQHLPPTCPQHLPHAWQKPTNGAKTQYAPEPDTSLAPDTKDTKHVQEVLGTLLNYCAILHLSALFLKNALHHIARSDSELFKSLLHVGNV
jgi:hypothetical protein